MCIGIPMRVIEAWPGEALAVGRGRCERLDTRLLGGDVAAGQWLLAFQGAARELLDTERAAEINAALDLLDAAQQGDAAAAGGDLGFALPSSMTAAQIAALSEPARGGTAP
jgi:hydrogenase expression/formation protein HypC